MDKILKKTFPLIYLIGIVMIALLFMTGVISNTMMVLLETIMLYVLTIVIVSTYD